MIIMLPKFWLQLLILLDHDDDEYHPNRNAMKGMMNFFLS
jgi:hypothetical protein